MSSTRAGRPTAAGRHRRAGGWGAAVLCALVGLSAGRVEAAAKTVTLLGIGGIGGAKLASALQRELADAYQMISGGRYREAAQRLGEQGADPAAVRAVARAIGADAIIGGAIVGKGRRRHLLMAVREGQSGRVVARHRYDLSGETLPLIRAQVSSDLVVALEHLEPLGRAPSPAPTPEPPPVAARESTGAGEEVAPAVPVSTPSEWRAVPGVQGGVGPSLLTRSLGFDVPAAPGYRGGTVAGIRVEGAVFPLALSAELAAEHPVLASFGLTGSYEHVFTFMSDGPIGDSPGKASRWDARVIGRIPLGHGAKAGVLSIDTGLQQMSWSAVAPLNLGVPDVRYDLLTAGLGWEHSLWRRWLVLAARFGAMDLLSMGDLGGESGYGRGTGFGLSARATLTWRPEEWLWVRVTGDWDRVAIHFAGAGTLFAKHATDDWIGGALEVGFAL